VAVIKKFDFSFLRYVLIASVIVFIIASYPVYRYASPEQTEAIIYGYLISLVNVIVGFGLNNAALGRKNKSFMVMVFGGMLIRMLIVAVLLVVLLYFAKLEPVMLTASFFFFYFLFISIEIKFLHKKIKTEKQN
jgi:membrane protein YdbS with pleckstrin-like domain